jgi:predicted peroxiredoxin
MKSNLNSKEIGMRCLKTTVLCLFFALSILTQNAKASDEHQSLFVNLTSDEINRAAMAINLSTRILQQKKIPVTIFLNVEGVRLVDKDGIEHKHATGKSLREMLTEFMAAGGRVLACPMCMKNVGGLEKEDLLTGVEVGGSDTTWPALFDEGVTVLSY